MMQRFTVLKPLVWKLPLLPSWILWEEDVTIFVREDGAGKDFLYIITLSVSLFVFRMGGV